MGDGIEKPVNIALEKRPSADMALHTLYDVFTLFIGIGRRRRIVPLRKDAGDGLVQGAEVFPILPRGISAQNAHFSVQRQFVLPHVFLRIRRVFLRNGEKFLQIDIHFPYSLFFNCVSARFCMTTYNKLLARVMPT